MDRLLWTDVWILLDRLDIRELCAFCYTKNRIYFDFSVLHVESLVNNERTFKCSPSTSKCFWLQIENQQSSVHCHLRSKQLEQQESPPAWMQEAYHPLCSEYFFCCPNWVPPLLTWPRGVPYLGTPFLTWPGGTLLGVPYLGTTPILTWLGGTLPGQDGGIPR